MGGSKNRVILIGIDGATWDLLDKFIEQGKLSVFARFKREGSWGVLKSTVPCFSPSAWNSIFTGVNPGKHEIFGFIKHQYNSLNLRLLNSADRNFPALWNYTDYYDIDSAFVNIPFSYPLEEVKGAFICGLGVPFQDHPYASAELKRYIEQNLPDYKIDFDEKLLSKKSNKQYFSKECFRILDSRLSLAAYLFAHHCWQIFSLVIRATDIIQHFYWDDQELIRSTYQKIDIFLSYIIDNMRPADTLIVVSDHGFSKSKAKIHLVNFFLQEGYMVLEDNRKIKKGADIQLIKNIVLRCGGAKIVEVLKRSPKLLGLFLRHFPLDIYAYFNLVDWHSSLVSYVEGSGGIVNFNPSLKANQEDLDSFFAGLRDKALDLRDEEGERVLEEVYKGSKLCWPHAPDLIFRARKGYQIDGYDPYDNSALGKSKDGYIGVHNEEGMVALYNPLINKGCELQPCKVYDILPTIFYLLGLRIPDYLDGRVIAEAFCQEVCYEVYPFDKDAFMRKKKTGSKVSDRDEKMVRKRLKGLGYL